MNEAYQEIILLVDLSAGTTENLGVPKKMMRDYIGGKGFGARLLYDLLPKRTNPLDADNLLMFMTGPLTGTMAPAMRGCVVTKSPLTGCFLDSYFGGSLSPEIKYAGYDGIIIRGKAEKPVYLWIDDNKIEIKDATTLWGLDTLEANHAIKTELKDQTIKVATIGQAGENQVPYALICCEYNRQAGRGGAGAVMGSKNLKALAIRGNGIIKVHQPEEFKNAISKANKALAQNDEVKALKDAGTASAIAFANETGLLPHKNYSHGTFKYSSQLADTGQAKHLWLGTSACMGCPIGCSKMGAVRTGKYKGTVTDIVEYESAALMGANLDIADVRAVAHLVKLCDRYGLDSMSTGSVIGFAMEVCEKGIVLSDEKGELKFGDVEAAADLIHAIAHKKGALGQLLAKGVKNASQELGKSAQEIAIHIKGMEAPAWGPRGATGMGLAIMTADRGACHQRGFPVSYEVGGVKWKGKTLDPLTPKGKADLVSSLQNYSAGTDTLVKCDFGGFGIQPKTYAELLNAATGQHITENIFDLAGERIWNLIRLFNLREGLDPAQDTLPQRFMTEPLPDGPHKGHKISEQDVKFMQKKYYAIRGWSDKGIPLDKTLKRLGIEK